MSRIRNNPKLNRIESFIAAIRQEAIRGRLEPVGLTKGVLAEGEDLSDRARRLLMGVPLTVRKTDLTDRVNRWEQRFYPILGASLRFDYPEVYATIFQGVQRGQGSAALPNVLTVAERLLDLAESTDATEKKAWALLGKRGVTVDDVKQIAALIRKGDRFTIVAGATKNERDQAVAEAWKFYLVWSEIARSVIPEKVLQRRMGIRSTKGAAPSEAAPSPASPEAPAPTVSPPVVATVAHV